MQMEGECGEESTPPAAGAVNNLMSEILQQAGVSLSLAGSKP